MRPVRAQAGFTFIGLLTAIVVLGILLAAVGEIWSTTAEHERERDLLYTGDQFRQAIGRFYAAGGRQYPHELAELIEDHRSPAIKRYLRKIWPDPMTGQADWTLIPAPNGGFMGVASSSHRAPLKRGNFPPQDLGFEDKDCVCDWQFIFQPRAYQRRINPAAATPSVTLPN